MARTLVHLDANALIFGFPAPADPQVSPDGNRLLYALVSADREKPDRFVSRLYTCAFDGSDARLLVEGNKNDSEPRWSPDGRMVAFVSDRVETGCGLYVVDPAGGEPRLLTRHRQPISGIAWSPDGRSIAYSTPVDPADPDEARPAPEGLPVVRVTRRLDYKLDGRGYLDNLRNQVIVLDIETGQRRRLTSWPREHVGATWSSDGRRLAVISAQTRSAQLVVADVRTGDVRAIGPDTGIVALLAWSPDASRLLLAADPGRTYQLDWWLWDGNSSELVQLTDDGGPQPHAGSPGWMPPSPPFWLDEGRVLFHGLRRGRSGLWLLDVASGAMKELASWDALAAGLSADAARRRFAQTRSSFQSPTELFTFELESRRGAVVSTFGSSVAGNASWERLGVKRGDLEIEGWLLKPSDFDPSRRYPLVLDVHGGPNFYHGHQWYAYQQLMVAHGSLVLLVNPRGSGTYGRHFAGQVFRDWGGEDYHDLMVVLDVVAGRAYVDPRRLGIFGYSYGGYMSSWVIGQTDRFRAAVVGAPCFDLTSMWGTSDMGASWDVVQWGGSPRQYETFFRERSPSTWAHRAVTPTLVIHGEADDRCPIGQGEELYTALQVAGSEAEFARYPDASHLFPFTGKPSQREDFARRVADWFDGHLR